MFVTLMHRKVSFFYNGIRPVNWNPAEIELFSCGSLEGGSGQPTTDNGGTRTGDLSGRCPAGGQPRSFPTSDSSLSRLAV